MKTIKTILSIIAWVIVLVIGLPLFSLIATSLVLVRLKERSQLIWLATPLVLLASPVIVLVFAFPIILSLAANAIDVPRVLGMLPGVVDQQVHMDQAPDDSEQEDDDDISQYAWGK